MISRRHFTNECGHKIELRVYDTTAGDVVIEIAGPHSISENILTAAEAIVLSEALAHVVKDMKAAKDVAVEGTNENAFIDTLEPAKS